MVASKESEHFGQCARTPLHGQRINQVDPAPQRGSADIRYAVVAHHERVTGRHSESVARHLEDPGIGLFHPVLKGEEVGVHEAIDTVVAEDGADVPSDIAYDSDWDASPAQGMEGFLGVGIRLPCPGPLRTVIQGLSQVRQRRLGFSGEGREGGPVSFGTQITLPPQRLQMGRHSARRHPSWLCPELFQPAGARIEFLVGYNQTGTRRHRVQPLHGRFDPEESSGEVEHHTFDHAADLDRADEASQARD